MATTNIGNGNFTSPATYEAVVAAETTVVAVKSKRRRDAPSIERDLLDTFRRYVYGAPLKGRAEASSDIIGRQKKKVDVAMSNEIGELEKLLL